MFTELPTDAFWLGFSLLFLQAVQGHLLAVHQYLHQEAQVGVEPAGHLAGAQVGGAQEGGDLDQLGIQVGQAGHQQGDHYPQVHLQQLQGW